MLSPVVTIVCIIAYFGLLLLISFFTGKQGNNEAFFIGDRKSPWPVVAFGMIGASLSGVTFISVPGWVGESGFSYFQMVLGYVPGYMVIAFVLMPLYYKLGLTSIYTYLDKRFGSLAYLTGSVYFLISRIIGAAFRLYLVAIVLQMSVFDQMGIQIPFAVTVLLTILLIWLYTSRGGIKTIVWTDTLQTFFMLLAVILTICLIGRHFQMSISELYTLVRQSGYAKMFYTDDWHDSRHFIKQFFSGAFIAIVMTGLDQDMMQKNLSCHNLRDARKNMISFSLVLVMVNLFFLWLGALLYIFASEKGIEIPQKSDYLYPVIAIKGYLGPVAGLAFVLGLIAAAYSSADSALTALTTSVCVDILHIERKEKKKQIALRRNVHIMISLLLLMVILIFKAVNDESVIKELFTVAGYTYGPLLGLFSFGIFTRLQPEDKYVLPVCVLAPVFSYLIKHFAPHIFNGYEIGFELLIINGMLTFFGLYLISLREVNQEIIPK